MAADHLLRLLLLSSTALPVGAYCYSQGVESAIDQQLIHDEASALSFMQDVMALSLGRYELPLLCQCYQQGDQTQWAIQYQASRESREMLAETRQLAYSLHRWLADLRLDEPPMLPAAEYGFLPSYAALARHWQLPLADTLSAYAFALLENQVLAIVKTVPLGQMAGQRILFALLADLPSLIARVIAEPVISSSLPGLARLSALHEQQYSRLFRS